LPDELTRACAQERGLEHTTSKCTLRGFTGAQATIRRKVASPAEIRRMRALATGHQIDGATGVLEAKSTVPHGR